MLRSYRQAEIMSWAEDMFGPVVRDRKERARRFLEEALEVVHSAGLEIVDITAMTDRVFAEAPGPLPKEIGQAGMCLEALAETNGLEMNQQIDIELDRVKTIPRSEWQRRHGIKVDLGIAKA